MSKQNLHNVDIVSGLEKADRHSSTKSNLSTPSILPRRYKALLFVTGVLAVVAVIAAAVAVVVAVRTSQELRHESRESEKSKEQRGDPLIDVETREQLLKQIADSNSTGKRQARAAPGKLNAKATEASCYSIPTNKTHPAAHIAGQGFKWTSNERNPPTGHGYQTSWVCANKSDAYVDGGMYFNQKDQKLYVPTCGYYYISSHILFQSDSSVSNSDSKYVRHQISIDRNCSYSDDWLLLSSYSSLTATPVNIGRTTTHIGDVVKMCTGGTISVIIPNDNNNPCCPNGQSQNTYLSAFMVAETSCDPSRSLNHPPTSEDLAAAS